MSPHDVHMLKCISLTLDHGLKRTEVSYQYVGVETTSLNSYEEQQTTASTISCFRDSRERLAMPGVRTPLPVDSAPTKGQQAAI